MPCGDAYIRQTGPQLTTPSPAKPVAHVAEPVTPDAGEMRLSNRRATNVHSARTCRNEPCCAGGRGTF